MWFVKQEYPESFDELTIALTAEEKSERSNYFYPSDTHDLVYAGLDHDIFLAFVSSKKIVNDPKGGHLASYSHISKFYCAIKWGSSVAERHLSRNFYSKVDKYMKSYQKEYARGKTRGITDERAADPVNCSLFKLLMT